MVEKNLDEILIEVSIGGLTEDIPVMEKVVDLVVRKGYVFDSELNRLNRGVICLVNIE